MVLPWVHADLTLGESYKSIASAHTHVSGIAFHEPVLPQVVMIIPLTSSLAFSFSVTQPSPIVLPFATTSTLPFGFHCTSSLTSTGFSACWMHNGPS